MWTEQTTEYVIAERAKGTESNVIAESLGISRGALLGKAHRLKLPPPLGYPRAPRPRKPKREITQPQAPTRISISKLFRGYAATPEPIVDTNAPPTRNLLLIELGDHDCRYGTSEDEQGRHLFCGAPQQGESSYCDHHHAVCRRPTRMLTDGMPITAIPGLRVGKGSPSFMGSILNPEEHV